MLFPCPSPGVILLPDPGVNSPPWNTNTVLLGGSVPDVVQIINSALYLFLRRNLICLWKRLSCTAFYDVTHRLTLMPLFLCTGISYTSGCTWGGSDHKKRLSCFGAICAFQTLWLLLKQYRDVLISDNICVTRLCANTLTQRIIYPCSLVVLPTGGGLFLCAYLPFIWFHTGSSFLLEIFILVCGLAISTLYKTPSPQKNYSSKR